jgi:hypothetical protein
MSRKPALAPGVPLVANKIQNGAEILGHTFVCRNSTPLMIRAIALSSSDFWHVLCFWFSYFPVEKSHVFIAGTVL